MTNGYSHCVIMSLFSYKDITQGLLYVISIGFVAFWSPVPDSTCLLRAANTQKGIVQRNPNTMKNFRENICHRIAYIKLYKLPLVRNDRLIYYSMACKCLTGWGIIILIIISTIIIIII